MPTLTVLATSQVRLGIDGEREIPVPPLPGLGGQAIEAGLEEIKRLASVQIFVDRAQAVRSDFEINARNAVDIARICERLEGIPLAIELCAAWVQALSPMQMLAQLDRRFDLLVSRRSDSEPRHRSLRAAVEHSYHLLSPELRQFFTRLAVFRGGWTLETAEAVAKAQLPASAEDQFGDIDGDIPSMAHKHPADSPPARIDSVSTLDLLMRLRDRSLVITEESGPEMRFRMLDTLRDFSWNQRNPSGDAALRRWHAEHFLSLAERAEPHLTGPDQAVWLDRLKAEHDNLRAALAWSVESAESEISWRLAAAVAPFWFARGHLAEGQDWLSRVADLPMPADVGIEIARCRAKALSAWGMLARNQGNQPKVSAALEEALEIWKELGDERGIAVTMQSLATAAYSAEDWDRADAYLEESISIIRKLGDPALEARAFVNRGNLALARTEWQRAREAYTDGLNCYRKFGDRIGMAAALNNLGLLALYERDTAGAIVLLNESLTIARGLNSLPGVAVALLNLSGVYRADGCYELARSLMLEGGTTASEAGERRLLPECLAEAGHLACAEQKFRLGAVLLSAAESMRVSMGLSAGPFGHKDLEEAKSAIREKIGDTSFANAWSEGSGLSFAQAFTMIVESERSVVSRRLS